MRNFCKQTAEREGAVASGLLRCLKRLRGVVWRNGPALLGGLVLLGNLALVATATPDGRQKPGAHQRGSQPVKVLPDATILANIKAKLAKSKMASAGFQVRVENGTAILEGKTDVIQRKGAMTRLAKKAGARNVQNNIVVSEEAKAKLRAQLAKGRHRDKARKVAPRSLPRQDAR